jgi:hypothetical protein
MKEALNRYDDKERIVRMSGCMFPIKTNYLLWMGNMEKSLEIPLNISGGS